MTTSRREVESLAERLRERGYTVLFATDDEGRIAGVMTYNGPGFPVGHVGTLVFAEVARKVLAVSHEIATAQAEYAARPFAVRWVDSHVSLVNRFHTFEDAFAYAQDQWAKIQKRVARTPNMCSQLWACYLETPAGRCSLHYWMLCDDVSSYR